MTTFAELVTNVYALTNRPDLVSETELAVRNATLKMHKTDFYFKDIFETGIQFTEADYLQSLDYKALIPTWRSLKYIRKYDPVGLTAGKFMEVITTEQVLDSYFQTKPDVVYGAGQVLQLRSSTKEAYYLLGCYRFPILTALNFSSWIADEQPSAIEREAARVIFKTIGYDEQASVYEKLIAEEIVLLKQDNILINGS